MGAADEEENVQGNQGCPEKILVSVRLRPLNDKEITRNDVSDWECTNDTTIIYRNNLSVSERSMYPSAYTFDRVFSPDCSTRQVYDEGAKEVALSVVSGINSSVFAYGQTSSGKTYTMSGITLYTVADIYDYIEKHTEREYILKFSAMEIYNESVRDLLSTDTTPLRLLDDPERGTVVERLTEESLRDWNHFRELLAICEAQRQIGETSLNETSSRSHQILRLVIESSAREFLGNQSSALMAAVNFVDLAGSERASQSLAAGVRLKEGCHINRSLLTLGTVIRKLSKGRTGHIPYRDSKLTRILQSSLGGNARTAIICTLSPARCHVEQSRNTLLFASCAKEVSTNAQVNVVMSDKALVKQLQRELARLENELRITGKNSSASDSTTLLTEKDRQIEKLMKEVSQLTQQLELAQSKVDDLLQAAEEDRPLTIWIDPEHQYPKLRVRNSFISENSVSYSLNSEDPHSDANIRSFDASRCSTRSSSSSEENFIRLEDLEEKFLSVISSPELPIRHAKSVGYDRNGKDTKEQGNEQFDEMCKEVQCISVEELSTKSHTNLNISECSPNRHLKLKKVECIEMETPSKERSINSKISETGTDTNACSDVSSPKKNTSCGVSSPKIDSSSGSSSPKINLGSAMSSPKMHSSSGFSSSKINTGSGMSSPKMHSSSGFSSPKINTSCGMLSSSDRKAESGASSPKKNADSGVLSIPDMNAGSGMSSPKISTGFDVLFSPDREAGSSMSSPRINTGADMLSSPGRNTGSCMSSPKINTGSSGVTEVENEDTVHQELGSSPLKELGNFNGLNSDFIIPSPERPSPWLTEDGMSSSRSFKLIRSRSCRARLLSLPVIWFDKEETNESTPPIGFEKEFTGRPEVSRRKVPEFKYPFDIENLSETSRSSVVVDDLKVQTDETVTDSKSSTVSNSDWGACDDLVEETKENLSVSSKSVKDVGLDPILEDVEPQKWPSEFKRLQKEIVELWHACNVSLVHRSYFFLLFKGDPTDAFYIEVERRRLSFLKETFSSGNKTMVEGRTLSLSSSKRALSEERQMLCKQMQRVLSRDERENIFLKWGIPLNSNQRKLQLAYYLWTKTTDMDHIIESATLVAKLVGFEGQDHSFKEMFGLLNFQPRRLYKRRSSIWKRSMLSIL